MNAITLFEAQKRIVEVCEPLYGINEARSISHFYLSTLLNKTKIQIYEKRNDFLPSDIQERFLSDLHRLTLFEPIQYVCGQTEFFGLPIWVEKGVLIPRPETEELVQEILIKKPENQQILDFCTGTGCIAIALKNNLKSCDVSACDYNTEILTVAINNAKLNNLEIFNFKYDILLKNDAFPDKMFDIFVSNPPYICPKEKEAMFKNVLEWEPDEALFVADENPLMFYEEILVLSQQYLNENGFVFFEINESYSNEILELFKKYKFKNTYCKKDLNNKWRIAVGQK